MHGAATPSTASTVTADPVVPRPPAPPAAGLGLPGAPAAPERLTWTAEEAAVVLGVTVAEARRLAARGTVPAIKLGRAWLFPRKGLRAWLDDASDPARRQAEAERRLALVRGGRRMGRRR